MQVTTKYHHLWKQLVIYRHIMRNIEILVSCNIVWPELSIPIRVACIYINADTTMYKRSIWLDYDTFTISTWPLDTCCSPVYYVHPDLIVRITVVVPMTSYTTITATITEVDMQQIQYIYAGYYEIPSLVKATCDIQTHYASYRNLSFM